MSPTLLRPAADAETERLDALPRMSHAARRRTIADTAAGPGRYLVAEGGGERRLLRLGPGTTHIGRGFAADLRLDDAAGSRPPAGIVVRDAGAGIPGGRPADGTDVNGRRAARAQAPAGGVGV